MENPSIISHLSLRTNDIARTGAFYDAVLATIGATRQMEHDVAIAWGKTFPEFRINTPLDEAAASVGNGTYVAFFADSKEQVHAFYETSLVAGATDDGPPGPRPQYGDPYYGCFVRDPDGNKIEATFWDQSLAG